MKKQMNKPPKITPEQAASGVIRLAADLIKVANTDNDDREQKVFAALYDLQAFLQNYQPLLSQFTAKHCPCEDCEARRKQEEQTRTSLSA